MARQLQAQGESVSLLALLDTAVPATKKAHQEPEDDSQLLVNLFAEEGIFLSLESALSNYGFNEEFGPIQVQQFSF